MAATLGRSWRSTETIRPVIGLRVRNSAGPTRQIHGCNQSKPPPTKSVLHNRQAIARFRFLTRLFKTRTPMAVYSYTHLLLNKPGRISWSIRSRFYTLIIRSFLYRKQWDLAYKLYKRMRAENVDPPDALLPELVMASRSMPATSPAVDEIVARYADRVHEPDELLLTTLIGRLVRQGGSPKSLSHVLKRIKKQRGGTWKPGWEICSLMAQAEARSGTTEKARRWFEKARKQAGNMWVPAHKKDAVHAKLQVIYTRFLLGLSERKGKGYTVDNVAKKMKNEHVSIPRILINRLIANAASRGQADVALGYYRAMKHSTPPIPGNKHTFYHIFSASAYAVKAPWILEMGGRRLYHDMSRQHLSDTKRCPHKPSNVLDYFTLNAALRYFMRSRDYAAATVTIRTFPVCHITPTQKTQQDVFDGLISRIKKEIVDASPESLLWADRMLGEAVRLQHWDHEQRVLITEKLHRAVSYINTSLTSTGVNLRFLLALLRRAVLASESVWPGKDLKLDDRTFRRVMKRASEEMLPPLKKKLPVWSPAASKID